MAIIRGPEKAILFVGSLFSSSDIFNDAEIVLKKKFGNVLFKSPSVPWTYSDYYNSELGCGIFRNFIFFDTIIDPSSLVSAKLQTKEIEEHFSKDNKRRINLDPGYITLAKVVLASNKNYSHRIYLGKGIYAELELFYKDRMFNPLFYTYFDYNDEMFIKIFTEARSLLKKQLSLT